MAEENQVADGAKNFLTHKIGPLPAGVWLAALVGGVYWYRQRQAKATASGTTAAVTPAGALNTNGSIGSSDSSGGGGSGGSTGTSGSTVGGQYTTNDAWSRAAINYLVGIGVDPTVANSAISQFLASQSLTPDQQADVNLAIQTLGAPPSAPQPGTAPPPVVTPPGGVVYANNPPTGVSVTGKSSTSVALNWNKVTNATGYTVSWTGGGQVGSLSVGGTDTTANVNGLVPNSTYTFVVQAIPARSGDPSGSVSTTTSGNAAPAPAPAPSPSPTPSPSPAPGPVKTPQVATLVDGWSLVKYNQEHYGGSAGTLRTLEQLNPGLNPNDSHHGGRILIRTSNG